MGPKAPDNVHLSWCIGCCVIFLTHRVDYKARRQTGCSCAVDADSRGHRSLVAVDFDDRAAVIMRTGRMAASAPEDERPL